MRVKHLSKTAIKIAAHLGAMSSLIWPLCTGMSKQCSILFIYWPVGNMGFRKMRSMRRRCMNDPLKEGEKAYAMHGLSFLLFTEESVGQDVISARVA